MSTVLVTGAGGFVGSAVVRALVAEAAALGRSVVERVVHSPARRLAEPTQASPAVLCGRAGRPTTASDGAAPAARASPRGRHTALDREVVPARRRTHRSDAVRGLAALDGARGSSTRAAPGCSRPGPGSPRTRPVVRGLRTRATRPRRTSCCRGLANRRGVGWIDLRLFNIFGRYEKPSRLLPYLVSRLVARGAGRALARRSGPRLQRRRRHRGGLRCSALARAGDACGALYHVGSGRGTSARELALASPSVAGDPELHPLRRRRDRRQDCRRSSPTGTRAARARLATPEHRSRSGCGAAAEWWLARFSGPRRHEQRRGVLR